MAIISSQDTRKASIAQDPEAGLLPRCATMQECRARAQKGCTLHVMLCHRHLKFLTLKQRAHVFTCGGHRKWQPVLPKELTNGGALGFPDVGYLWTEVPWGSAHPQLPERHLHRQMNSLGTCCAPGTVLDARGAERRRHGTCPWSCQSRRETGR